MHRRRFITAWLGALLAATRLQALAQAVPRIGLLTGGSESGSRARFEAFRKGLRELGYLDSTVLEFRYANDDYSRLPTLAAELVRLNVGIIVSNGTPATLAAKEATTIIPIIMVETADPVGSKLVASLARPGGNVTGVAQLVSSEVFGKQLQMLKEVVPGLVQAGLLFNPANPVQRAALSETQSAAKGLGMTVHPLGIDNPAALEGAVTGAVRIGVTGLIVTRDNLFLDHMGRLIELAARHRLPVMYGSRPFAAAGGLIAYGPDPENMARRAAVYVDRVLKGARPADLPVEQPSKLDLAINLRTARALGLTIPPSLTVRADHVIE